ncbi:hypothetical protein NPIL_610401 [Nephila pilipes]|uniref:Uncharacterized protein n=1 Tax=Nephila pilipes TaxID=299642 RepID=A0A8X6QM71_NEPPI|nr:hypothetical protein NPIL_610401 [Nephila pilipes]
MADKGTSFYVASILSQSLSIEVISLMATHDHIFSMVKSSGERAGLGNSGTSFILKKVRTIWTIYGGFALLKNNMVVSQIETYNDDECKLETFVSLSISIKIAN